MQQLISPGALCKPIVGDFRVVRVGNVVELSGIIAQEGNAVADAHAQTKRILEKSGAALQEAGASFADVVCTRIVVTDILQREAVGP
jgi:enamine deaminase RidA (YjgF/YER057c/UK114 family)